MKKSKGFTPIVIVLIIVAVLAVGSVAYYAGKSSKPITQNVQENNNQQQENKNNIVGGDKDEHGCIGSAGYSWCAVKNKCLRIWEEKCESTPAAANTKNITINGVTITIPANWQIRAPIINNDCERSIMCLSAAGSDGTSSYKIYNPSVTTGTKTSDIDAIYITVGDCANSAIPCPILDFSNNPNSLLKFQTSVYRHGLTVSFQIYGAIPESKRVYDSIINQL